MSRILLVAGEATPFVKTGGLGQVIGSLPKALQAQELDVRVILPKYGDIPLEFKKRMKHLQVMEVPISWRKQYGGIEVLNHDGVIYYFIDNEYYFKRAGLYGHYDDAERFAFFCRAVLDSLQYIDFKPDILHCHDWHTGMVPVFLKAFYGGHPYYQGIKTVFTIHNLKYQGVFSHWVLHNVLGLGDDFFNGGSLEYYGQVNYMKGALEFSDALTTVSPTYAEEVKYCYFGEGLDGLFREKGYKLHGILNGIDYEEYNPQTDSYIPFNYNQELDLKEKNKAKLQERLALTVAKNKPVLAIVSRLTEQKGLDLLLHILEELLNDDIQLVILGTGEEKYEEAFKAVQGRHPQKFRIILRFDEAIARLVYAASDIYLMPSLFEPCGLSQLIALRYGSLPVVRETGGLKDTILSYNENTGEGNGFSFTNYNAHDFLTTIRRALAFYENKDVWSHIVNNAFNADFSWDRSAQAYKSLYDHVKAGVNH